MEQYGPEYLKARFPTREMDVLISCTVVRSFNYQDRVPAKNILKFNFKMFFAGAPSDINTKEGYMTGARPYRQAQYL